MRWGRRAISRALPVAVALTLATGCVTVAEFRKLEREVVDLERGESLEGGAARRERVAELAERLDALEREAEQLRGRLEVTEHRASQALEEARLARQDAASRSVEGVDPRSVAPVPAALPEGATAPEGTASVSEEVAAYRAGYSQWRSGAWDACVDRFRIFLQTYPSSVYADDSAYWLADCYFKQGDFKTAILRFDDVVSRYPEGNKAADALYRQGEALLRLGPGYGRAAEKAFERVLREYPQSARVKEAKRQLELLETG